MYQGGPIMRKEFDNVKEMLEWCVQAGNPMFMNVTVDASDDSITYNIRFSGPGIPGFKVQD